MPKVLICSDSPFLYTGMARVVRELGSRFIREGWMVDYAAWFHRLAAPAFGDYCNQQTTFYSMERREDTGKLLKILLSSQPEVLLCIGDLFYFLDLPKIKWELQREKVSTKFLGYLNVDSDIVQPQFFEVIDSFDGICVHTEFGKRALLSIPSKFSKESGRIRAVHHGVDFSFFHPPVKRESHNSLQFLVVARNCLRKNIPFTIEAFSRFSADKTDVKLFLATDMDSPEGHNLRAMILSRPNLWGKVSFTESITPFKGLSDTAISEIYQASDVLIDWPMAEGFGLPVLEAMASKVLVLGIAYSSFPELLDGDENNLDGSRGYLIQPGNWLYGQYGQRMAVPDVGTAVNLLERIYSSWNGEWNDEVRKVITNAYEWSRKKTWDRCFKEICSEANRLMSSKEKEVAPFLWQFPVQTGARVYATEEVREARRRGRGPCIGICKLGGLGDILQLLPVIKGIKRAYPNSYVIVAVGSGENLLRWLCERNHLVDGIVNMGNVHQQTALKTFSGVFDLFYDVRYVSRVYGERPTEFFNKYRSFYDGWAFSNARLRSLGTHVVDLMLNSLGLNDFASLDDLLISRDILDGINLDLTGLSTYVVVHNSAGGIGNLKALPEEEIARLIRVIHDKGYSVAQVGINEDPELPGVDLDFRSKLNIQEFALVLSQARLYVGLEGFWYHLAHSLGVPTYVWFTCTPPECFSYKEDLVVLFEDRCEPCWWSAAAGDNWWKVCISGERRCLNLPSIEVMEEKLSNVLMH